jgi:putative hydrolase of the HAD superfamily
MPKIRAIVFDHYGTLVDIWTNEEKPEVFHYLALYLQYYGADIDAEMLRYELKAEKAKHLKSRHERYPEVDLEVVFKNILTKHQLGNPFMAESCCRLFRLFSRERFQLFPDTMPVLTEMKKAGYPMALVSDAQKVFALEEVKMLGLSQFFPYIVLSTYLGFRKPDPRIFGIAYGLLQIPPAEAVYIGDSPERDIQGAQRSGMPVIQVRSPKPRDQKTEADFYAKDLWEAWEWIKKNNSP